MRVRTGKLRLSAQNTYYTKSRTRVPGDVITLSGRYVYDLGTSSTVLTWANYLAKTQEECEDRLRTVYQAEFPEVKSDMRGTIVLDLEGDADGHNTHPNELHEEDPADQLLIAAAWKLRLAAVRAVFPYCRLGLWSTLAPNSRGIEGETYLARKEALVFAGTTAGGAAFDGLDFLCPNVFPAFGPDDSANNYGSYYAMTYQGCSGSYEIKKSDGSSMALLPFIGAYVSNGGSNNNDELLIDFDTDDPLGETWGEQFRAFKDFGVDEVAFWNGTNTRNVFAAGTMSSRQVAEYVHAGKGW